jgi:tRNA (adenine22-N1)-methyltransferase
MIRLSERLARIASYIEDREGIADVGTDHGYLPIYLLERNPNRRVIFTDVNEGPLSKTRNIIEKEQPYMDVDDFDLRIGDGLIPIKKGEVDAVAIAGMGGILIKDILAADIDKTKSFKKLILQPRTASDKLRKWLIDNDLYIYDEDLAYENGRISEIIAVGPFHTKDVNEVESLHNVGNMQNTNAIRNVNALRNNEFKDELDYEFSPILINKLRSSEESDEDVCNSDSDIVKDWLNRALKKEEYIKASLVENGSEESKTRIKIIDRRIEKLKGVMKP